MDDSLLISTDALLQPLEDNTAGAYLFYEPAYDVIKKARMEDDSKLSRGVWEIDLKKAEHTVVEKTCVDILAHQSKDLQVLAWLVEAWFVLYGVSGATRGLEATVSFLEKYWTIMYPLDPEHRIHIFEWMDAMLSAKFHLLPLTSHENTARAYHFQDYQNAKRLDKDIKRDPKGAARLLERAGKRGEPTLASFKEIYHQTPKAYIKRNLKDIQSFQKSLLVFKNTLETQLEKEAPAFSATLKTLSDILVLIDDPSLDKVEEDPKKKAQQEEADTIMPLVQEVQPPLKKDEVSVSDNTFTRAQAYQQLRSLAETFEKIEPHSPTANILKNIASFEKMQLAEILETFAKGGDAMTLFMNLISAKK